MGSISSEIFGDQEAQASFRRSLVNLRYLCCTITQKLITRQRPTSNSPLKCYLSANQGASTNQLRFDNGAKGK